MQNVRLSVGGRTEEVSVVGEAPVIESDTTSVGQVIDQRTVQEIPLNGRHFVDLGLLIPGSVAPQPATGFLTAPLRGQGSFAFNTAGNREDTVNFMINGINLNDQVQNQITFQPSINTVQEFKVDNQTLSAEYGRSSGAVVNIATRSGTNDLHGELFEFLRDESLDARNSFNPESQPQSPFERHQFGANIGGPILKNRTFFFLSYEGLRQRQQLDFNSGVLSDAQRAAVTDPVVRNLLPLIPAANATGANGAPRFLGTGTANVDIDQVTLDLSHQLGAADRLHGYYAFQRDERGEPNLQGNTIPGFGDTRSSHRQILTLNETHVFGPTVVNEVRVGFNRIDITFAPNLAQAPAELGINNGITEEVLPQITVQGVGLNFGGPSDFPQGRTDTTFVFSDSLTWLRGRHSFKAGLEYRNFHNVNFQTNGGTFTYASLADFQAGRGSAFTATLGAIDSDLTQQALGLFVQDNLRLRPNLTLELGIRYDRNLAPTEADDRFVYFDPATVSLQQVGQGGRETIYESQGSLQPRFGVVWDPFADGRTAVRAAYSMLTDQPVTNLVTPTAGNPPLVTPLTFTGPIRLDNALAVAGPAGLAPSSVDEGFETPRIQTWNVNVQRELSRGFSAMVGYFGSKGDRLRVSRNLNQLTNGVRPYPAARGGQPHPPGCGARQHRRGHEPRPLALRRALGLADQALRRRAPVQRVVHAVGVTRHELALVAGRRGAGQHRHRGRLRPVRLRRAAPLRDLRDLGAAVQGQPPDRGLADHVRDPGPERQPDQRRHGLGEHRRHQHRAARRDRDPGRHRPSRPVVLGRRLRSADAWLLHRELGLRAAVRGGRHVPLRQPRAQLASSARPSSTPTCRSSRRRASPGPRSSCGRRRSTCSTTRTSASQGASRPSAAPPSA